MHTGAPERASLPQPRAESGNTPSDYTPTDDEPAPGSKSTTHEKQATTTDASATSCASTPEASPPPPAPEPDSTSSTPQTAASCNQPAETTATTETAPAPTTASDAARLAPGALRQLVEEFLTAHSEEAFTATAISRVIERSSGAIANALVTLTKQGTAHQVSDHPRRYQLATPPGQQP